MKICWDNLETLHFTWNGNFRKGNDIYVEKEKCPVCGDPYLTVKSKPNRVCSKSCGKIGKKRIPMPKEQRVKISKSIGGKNHPFYGKHLSEEHKQNLRGPKTEEHKENMSKAAKKRFEVKENHPSWKGGVRKKNIPLYDTYAHQISYAEKVKRSSKKTELLEVKCVYCDRWFIPTTTEVQSRTYSLNNNNNRGECRFYCSVDCKMACPIYCAHKYPKNFKKASSREVNSLVRQMCFKRDNWLCQICGKSIDEVQLHCHHIEGYAQNPVLGNDVYNVITLCKECHKEVHKLPGCNYYELRCN